MSTLDVVILIPTLPAFPILATIWLPWERWIPWGKIPKTVLGPYLLYLAFAAWHFKVGWPGGIPLVAGIVVTIWAIHEKVQARRAD